MAASGRPGGARERPRGFSLKGQEAGCRGAQLLAKLVYPGRRRIERGREAEHQRDLVELPNEGATRRMRGRAVPNEGTSSQMRGRRAK